MRGVWRRCGCHGKPDHRAGNRTTQVCPSVCIRHRHQRLGRGRGGGSTSVRRPAPTGDVPSWTPPARGRQDVLDGLPGPAPAATQPGELAPAHQPRAPPPDTECESCNAPLAIPRTGPMPRWCEPCKANREHVRAGSWWRSAGATSARRSRTPSGLRAAPAPLPGYASGCLRPPADIRRRHSRLDARPQRSTGLLGSGSD
jgi:hypothetical protein